jgi:prolyl-tRNA synthetase family II
VRWSQAFVPTLRDDPADAEAASHKLLVRGGFIRQLMAGSYSLLPLGFRTCQKIERILRTEMERIGAQEFQLPAMHPGEIWKRSGRWDTIGDELFRLKDRSGSDLCLAFTNEEIFTWIARELRSYKELPQIWFHVQSKFRDEPRPKSGLLRVREFRMKDSYSLDVDEAGLDVAFRAHFDAYRRIFERCGVETMAVEASSGVMGDGESVEFMIESPAGEDWVASCSACGYAANVEKATSELAVVADEPGSAAPEKFATPGVRTIEALASFEGGAAAERQIKTLVYEIDGQLTLVLLRGDHPLNEQKLADATGSSELRPADAEKIRAALGADPGSLGAVAVGDLAVLADEALRGRSNMTTGANEDDFHLRGVDVARDIEVAGWHDLREVQEGEPCPACSTPLQVRKTIEVAHIFKLGTKYSDPLGAGFLDQNGKSQPVVMGCYGIGIGRTMAAIAEVCHDENGLIWPVSVAPFEVVVAVLNPKQTETLEAGTRIYEALQAEGIDVLLDDRDERPGVKFKDSELIGIPWRITVGPKGLAEGKVELFRRRGARKREVDVHKAAESVIENVMEER